MIITIRNNNADENNDDDNNENNKLSFLYKDTNMVCYLKILVQQFVVSGILEELECVGV